VSIPAWPGYTPLGECCSLWSRPSLIAALDLHNVVSTSAGWRSRFVVRFPLVLFGEIHNERSMLIAGLREAVRWQKHSDGLQ
jgi:hypothetical protein